MDTGTPPQDVGTPCQPPTFTPPDGAVFTGAGSVVINAPSGFPAMGDLFYTTDQTIPTHASKAYVGPIQVTQSETITAIAFATGTCTDSTPAHASYTVNIKTCDSGGQCVADPDIAPTSQKSFNDFLASITDTDSAATICYRLDGSLPTCGATGLCGNGSTTYNGGSLISINGSLPAPTNPPTGAVTLTAIACDDAGNVADCGGGPNGIGCEADYVLTVSDPFMTNPPGSSDLASGGTYNAVYGSADIPSGNAGISPSLATITVSSSEPTATQAVSIWYSTVPAGSTAPTPSCITGTPGANPTIFNASSGTATTITKSTEIVAMGCKQGYHNSDPVNFTYTLQLASPTIAASATFNQVPTVGTAATSGVLVSDATNGSGAADTLCYTGGDPATTKAPTCAATGGCGTGSSSTAPTIGNTTSTQTIVEVLACPATSTVPRLTSPVVTGTYTLQYAQPFIASNATLGDDLPGWGYTKGGSGAPITTFNIPSTAAVPYPGASGWDVAQVQPACVQGPTSEFGTTAPTGCTLNQAADYFCYTTKATTTAACGTDTSVATMCANAATTAGNAFTGEVSQLANTDSWTATSLPASAGSVAATSDNNTTVGNTFSIVACELKTAGLTTTLWAPSVATTVGPVTHANQATQPTVAQASASPSTVQEVVTLTNGDANPSLLCFTTDGTTPTCAVASGVATCSSTGTIYCANNSTTAGSNGPLTGASCTSATPLTGALIAAASSGTIFQVPQAIAGSAGAVAANTFLQANTAAGSVINAIACNALEGTSALVTTTADSFALAKPDFGSSPQVSTAVCATGTTSCAGSANWDTTPAKTIGVGTPVYITDTSNFDFVPTGSAPAISVHWSWGGTPDCGTVSGTCPAGTIGGVASTTGCGNASASAFGTNKNFGQVYSFWSGAATTVPTPATGSSVTLNAIACGQTTNLQANSGVQSVTFNVQAAAPILVTDQSCLTLGATAANCGTNTCTAAYTAGVWNAPNSAQAASAALASGTGGCPAVAAWDNAIHFVVAGLTPGVSVTNPSYLCISTSGTPNCTAGSGCDATAQYSYTDNGTTSGNVSIPLTVDGTSATNHFLSGTTIYASACTGTLGQQNMTPVQFALNDSTGDFVSPGTTTALPTGSTVACGVVSSGTTVGTLQSSISVVQDVLAATYQAGGPTANECFCWTQDGTPVDTHVCAATPPATNTLTALNNACLAVANGAHTPSTHCAAVSAALGGTASFGIDGPASITWATCTAGALYTNAVGTPSYKVAPYAHPITVDGNVKDWYLNQQNSTGSATDEAQPEAFVTHNIGAGAGAGLGLVSYDATNLYLGFVDATATTTGTVAYTNNTAMAFTGTSQAVGLVIGNGAASQSTAPLSLPAAAGTGFSSLTLSASEGAQYFVLWPTGGATTTVYQWTAGSPGSWAVVASVTPNVETGLSTGAIASAPDFEMSIPFASLPAITSTSTELTVQGIYVTNFGTGTPAAQFSWATSPAGATDGWVNDFTNSCVAPSQTDNVASAVNNLSMAPINQNPGQ